MRTLVVCAAMVAFGPTLQAQGPTQSSNATPLVSITGRVVDADTGTPVPNVRITTTAIGVGVPVVLTDDTGNFSLPVPSGRYRVVTSKTGYGRQEVAAVAGAASIAIRLSRAASISGRVIDEYGDPVIGVGVSVEEVSSASGSHTTAGVAETDDRGEYRVGNLPAGTFAVSIALIGPMTMVRLPNGAMTGQPRMDRIYFPDARGAADAQRLPLSAGEERTAVDFLLSATQALSQPLSVANALGPLSRPNDPAASAVVRGRVVTLDGRAIGHAVVRLSSQAGPGPGRGVASRTIWSESDGRFEFKAVLAGMVTVAASKGGYFPSGWPGSGSIALPSFELANGQTHEELEVRLAPWATVEGRIVDEHGEPVARAAVQLLRPRWEEGRRSLVGAGAQRFTDDRGLYRLYGIAPGNYIVSASVGQLSSVDLPGYPRSFYPGSPEPANAQYVGVQRGDQLTGIDVSMARSRTARISGTLLNAAGQPTMGGSVNLVPSRTSIVGVSLGARIDPDGAFEFVNVPPGQYVIQVSRGRTNASTEGESAAVPVSIGDSDISGLVVQATSGSRISGRITFRTGTSDRAPRADSIEVVPVPVDADLAPLNNIATARINPNGMFDMAGITGTRRLQVVRTPRGYAVEIIRAGGMDVTDRPLEFGGDLRSISNVEIVMTDRVSTVAGTLVDDRSRPVSGASAVVFSMDRRNWYEASRFFQTAGSDADGAFAVQGLPTGSYYVAATRQLPADGAEAWQDPQYLESLIVAASTISVVEGQSTSIRLRVPPR